MGAGASAENKPVTKNTVDHPFKGLSIIQVKKQITENILKADALSYNEWTNSDGEKIILNFKHLAYCDHVFRPKIYSDEDIIRKLINLFMKLTKDYIIGENDPNFKSVYHMIAIHWNGSDISEYFCQQITESGELKYIIENILTHWRLEGNTLIDKEFVTPGLSSEQRLRIMKGLLGIIHNVLRNTDDARQIAREAGGIEILRKLLLVDDPGKLNIVVEAKCNINLAYLVREDESDKIDTNERVIRFIAKLLEGGLNSSNHIHKRYHFAVDETLLAMNKLAASDCNKELMAEYIPLLVQAIDNSLNEKEQLYASRCLWILSFNEKCREIIKKPEHLRTIEKVSKSGSNDEIKKSVHGVIWQISQNDKRIVESDNQSEEIVGHVMLSYQWAFKPIVLKIRDFLKSKGYHVWIDVDSMSIVSYCLMKLSFQQLY